MPNQITAQDVAKYFLFRAINDGELISPLKMQKLVYYAYSWVLVQNDQRLFNEKIEAWPMGPVVPSLYRDLKDYGNAPISDAYLGFDSEDKFDIFLSQFSKEIKATLDKVYEKYMTMTAFELVVLTHSELPWVSARDGLLPTESSDNEILDEDIKKQYGEEKG